MKKIVINSLFLGALLLIACNVPCDGVICQNGGICEEGRCLCLEGFTGINCEIDETCLTCTMEGQSSIELCVVDFESRSHFDIEIALKELGGYLCE